MRVLLLLVLLLPAHALAFGVGSGFVSTKGGGSVAPEAPRCDFAVQLPGYSGGEYVCRVDAAPVTTTRAGGATCIGGGTVTANVACVSAGGLECFLAGVGDRTAADLHLVSTAAWPVDEFRIELWARHNFAGNPPASAYLIESGRGSQDGVYLNQTTAGSLVFGVISGGASSAFSVGAVDFSFERHVVVERSAGVCRVFVDGAMLGSRECPAPTVHRATAGLGGRYLGAGEWGGFVRLVRVSRPPALAKIESVYAIGDSQTHGTPWASIPYPARLQTLLGSGYMVTKQGVGGETTAQIRTRWETALRAQAPDIIVVQGGGNDISGGGTATAAYANLSAIYSQALADGARVVTFTVMPHDNWNAAQNEQLALLNASILGTAGVAAVDTHSAVAAAGDPTKLNPAYNSGDGTHLNDAGAAVVAALVAAAIQ